MIGKLVILIVQYTTQNATPTYVSCCVVYYKVLVFSGHLQVTHYGAYNIKSQPI